MARYIDADEFYEGFCIYAIGQDKNFIKAVEQVLEDTLTADVEEVKHAFWEEYWDDDYGMYFHRCIECKNDAPAKRNTYCDQALTEYCPNCGAKMDGGKTE